MRMTDERLAEILSYFHDGNLEAQYEIEPSEWRDALIAEREQVERLVDIQRALNEECLEQEARLEAAERVCEAALADVVWLPSDTNASRSVNEMLKTRGALQDALAAWQKVKEDSHE